MGQDFTSFGETILRYSKLSKGSTVMPWFKSVLFSKTVSEIAFLTQFNGAMLDCDTDVVDYL